MEQVNKIQAITKLFKNIRDTLSHDEINDIRLKIYRNEKLYDHYISQPKLNKKQQAKFNKVINNINELH